LKETLLDVARALLAIALTGERLFLTALFTGLEIEGVTLDFFYDIFLLYLALKAAQSALQCFTILEMDFCQTNSPPSGSMRPAGRMASRVTPYSTLVPEYRPPIVPAIQ